MLYLATASTPLVRDAMRSGLLGQMVTADAGNRLEPGVPWAADNGCFNARWKPGKWVDWLDTLPLDGCLFAVVPDVVADPVATRARWLRWRSVVAEAGFPAAYVLQDGEQCPPWDELDCLFIGGSTEYKLSDEAWRYATEAKQRGKWVHMGRVNSERRMEIAARFGCDSVDGTFLAFGPDTNLPKLLRWVGRPSIWEAS